MFEMFISQGAGPGHISSRSQVGGFLTLVEWQVAAGAALVIFVALPVDGVCRSTAGFLGVSDGMLAVGTAGCGLGVAGVGLTGNIPGEDSGVAGGYICADRHV